MVIHLKTTLTKMSFGLTIHLSAEGLDEGSDVELFFL